jgi:hypothetical protein
MKRKVFIILGIVTLLGFNSCGGDSKKAKEVLRHILKVVGIPYPLVANICQDGNGNGVCESAELQMKVSIKRGDDIPTIMQKVSLSENGEYFLEHYDPKKPILMEIKDPAKVNYNNGKFTFIYDPKTEELSILQMMIDKGYLSANDVAGARMMPNVDKFYNVLFQDFEINLNTLEDEAFSSPRAVLANMREMAEELIDNGIQDTLPQNISSCNGDTACIEATLAPISKELLIDEHESREIKNRETLDHKKLVANKTLYTFDVDDKGNIEIYKDHFNNDVTSYTWEIIEGENKGEKGTNTISLDSNILTDHTENEVYLFLGEYDDYILYEYQNKKIKIYFDLEKLKEDLQYEVDVTNSSQTEEESSIGFTKEMLQNKVVYDLSYVESDGTKGYGKTTFRSDRIATRREIEVSSEGEIISDESEDVTFRLEDGQIIYDYDNYSWIFKLKREDDKAWYIVFNIDRGKDGSIEYSQDKTLYFTKPSDYPAEL